MIYLRIIAKIWNLQEIVLIKAAGSSVTTDNQRHNNEEKMGAG
jgi:hypothetical protein